MDTKKLREVFNLAGTLHRAYPDTKDRLDQYAKNLHSIRNCPALKDLEANALFSYNETRRVCDEWNADLRRLAELVRQNLPVVWSELEIVGRFFRWHDEPIDWSKGIGELRRIEAKAENALAGGVVAWSKLIGYNDLRQLLGLSQNTLKARLVASLQPTQGKIRYQKATENARKIQVAIEDLPAAVQAKLRPRS